MMSDNNGNTVPDLSYCHSVGDILMKVPARAVETIECYLEGLLLDGE